MTSNKRAAIIAGHVLHSSLFASGIFVRHFKLQVNANIWLDLLRRQSVDRRPDQRRKLHRRRLGEDHLRERTDQLGVGERAQVNIVITQDSVYNMGPGQKIVPISSIY